MQVFLLIVICLSAQSAVVEYNIEVKHVIYNPDGYPLQVIGVYETNKTSLRPFPGPLIRGTIGDTLHVTIHNKLHERTSLHFHGIHMHNNVWMDGVIGITECGIAPGSSFTYSFKLTQTGTYWYHSHSAVQYGDGLFGPLVIDYPKGEDPVFNDFRYNTEHIVFLQDWLHETGNEVLLYYGGPFEAFAGFSPMYPWPPQSLLIGGIGNTNCETLICPSTSYKNSCAEAEPQCYPSRPPLFGSCNTSAYLPMQFKCPVGEHIRMRIINAGSNLPSRFWIDRHNMIIVAKDGVETEHLVVDHITIPVAQRIDVIVLCNQNARWNYPIFSVIPANFLPNLDNLPNIYASALLTYSNSNKTHPGKITPDMLYKKKNDSLFFEYKLKPKQSVTFSAAAKRIFLFQSLAYACTSGPLEQWTINNITFQMSAKPFLPAKYNGENINNIIQSNPGVDKNVVKTHIEKLIYGQIVEVVLVSLDMQQHPWHVHGQWVNFVGAGCLNSSNHTPSECNKIEEINYTNINKKLESVLIPYNQKVNVTSIGDSFTLPGYGYVAFRFNASNPGPWFMHCHVEWHLSHGMSLILSVEKEDGTYPNIGEIPSNMIPQCAPYITIFRVNSANPSTNSCVRWIVGFASFLATLRPYITLP